MGPSQPVWFDPKLFGGVRRYAGAVWLAGAIPAAVAGSLLAGPPGALLVLLLWGAVCLAGASVFRRVRTNRLHATRPPARCIACGEQTFARACPACGGTVERHAADPDPTHGGNSGA
jgi:hypothetical protein